MRGRHACSRDASSALASQGSLSKKLHIKTFGCQMNAYDSGRMAEALEPAGFVLTEDQAQADLVILNTCHIREKAAEKVYSELVAPGLSSKSGKERPVTR